MSGHGSYDPANGFTTVPDNTWVYMPTWHGSPISLEHGYSLDLGPDAAYPTSSYPGSEGAHWYGPGSKIPNYTLNSHQSGGNASFVPGVHPTYGPAFTVPSPTTLSDIFNQMHTQNGGTGTPENLGVLYWSACMNDMSCAWTPYYAVPTFPPAGAEPQFYPALPDHTHPRWPKGNKHGNTATGIAPSVPPGQFGLAQPANYGGKTETKPSAPFTSFSQLGSCG
jgi:hypothetical protein